MAADLVPAHTLNAGYHPKRHTRAFQHRPLFDMQFDESMRGDPVAQR